MSGDAFIDLRLNRQEGQIHESFWPSFTDIMTVVVMIFLIAMVVLLMRNMELVHQLRATMEAERLAAELARATGAEKETLATQLHSMEDELSRLRLALLRSEEERATQQQTLNSQADEVAALAAERERLQVRIAQASRDNQQVRASLRSTQAQLETARQVRAGLEQNLASSEARLASSEQELDSLQQAFAQQSRDLEASRSAGRLSGQQLQALRDEYDRLEIKYNELVKPARSPGGRHVVEVLYARRAGEIRIGLRDTGEKDWQTVSRKQLEQRLDALKARHDEGLYVKVIIPDNSGLSFNEAWSFTNAIHRGYDYYFQEPAKNGDDAKPVSAEAQ